MFKRFHYTDLKGKESDRVVYPLSIVDDKIFAIDVSEYSAEEREEYGYILEAIHKQYIQAIKDAGLSSNFRYFFIDKME